MKSISTEETLQEKLKELEAHYLTYRKLIDAGLIIATTGFSSFLDAVEFDKAMSSKWNIYISAEAEKWGSR